METKQEVLLKVLNNVMLNATKFNRPDNKL